MENLNFTKSDVGLKQPKIQVAIDAFLKPRVRENEEEAKAMKKKNDEEKAAREAASVARERKLKEGAEILGFPWPPSCRRGTFSRKSKEERERDALYVKLVKCVDEDLDLHALNAESAPSQSSLSSKTCSQASQRSKSCSESLSQGSQSSLVCEAPGGPPPKKQKVHLPAHVKDLFFDIKEANAIVGNDDKRQCTLVVGMTASGKLAGRSQIIWAGETTGCHPKGDEYKAFDKLLFHSHSASHWTTEDTLLEYVQDLFDNHVVPTIKQQGGDVEHQKWVLLYDCYSVHRSHDVLCELKTRFPTLIVLFVPASCMGELQPLDLAFFSIFKSGLARLCAMWMTDIAKTQLLRGVQPDAITYDLRLSTLRLPFVTWVHTMLTKISAEKTVALTKGWDMSGISIVWSNDEADKDECDELYDEARQWEREGKLFQVAGGRSKDAAVGGLLEQQVLQPPRNRKRKRDDADTEEDVEYSADEEEEEENDPAWADMMAEMAEEDDDVVANDSDDENQLPDDLASCFKPCTTRSGRTTRPPVRS
uniref:DDE-1 domain-containing protein n=1 Tax=Eutreptiella gymnastica TaxID=73025 RepID=A0A7S4GKV6_9EUGL